MHHGCGLGDSFSWFAWCFFAWDDIVFQMIPYCVGNATMGVVCEEKALSPKGKACSEVL